MDVTEEGSTSSKKRLNTELQKRHHLRGKLKKRNPRKVLRELCVAKEGEEQCDRDFQDVPVAVEF